MISSGRLNIRGFGSLAMTGHGTSIMLFERSSQITLIGASIFFHDYFAKTEKELIRERCPNF
jgi:hypothetical protein